MKNGKEVRPNGVMITKAPNHMYYVGDSRFPFCFLKDARRKADETKPVDNLTGDIK